jgi:hypothetical protein
MVAVPEPARSGSMSSHREQRDSPTRGLQIHISKLLLLLVVAAIASTAGLVVTAIMLASRPGPRPGIGVGGPPPPPLEGLIVTTGLFVASWSAVLIILSRDQIIQRLAAASAAADGLTETSVRELLSGELTALEDRIGAMTREYGEQRETDGFLNGMRVGATSGRDGGAEVRPLRGGPSSARLTP